MSGMRAGGGGGHMARMPYVNTVTGKLRNTCPVCGAKPGWLCTKMVGGVLKNRSTIHTERNARGRRS